MCDELWDGKRVSRGSRPYAGLHLHGVEQTLDLGR